MALFSSVGGLGAPLGSYLFLVSWDFKSREGWARALAHSSLGISEGAVLFILGFASLWGA